MALTNKLLFKIIGICSCVILGINYFEMKLEQNVYFVSFTGCNHTKTRRPGKHNCQQEYDSFTLDTRHGCSSNTVEKPTVCRRKKIKPTIACRYIQKAIDEDRDECKKYKKAGLCSVEKAVNSVGEANTFNCSFARKFCSLAWIGIMSNATSSFLWLDLDLRLIEQQLKFVPHGLTYLLKCKVNKRFKRTFVSAGKTRYQVSEDRTLMQALWFFKEPGTMSKSSEEITKQSIKPSISILFTDSVSRTLAFRSLPKTVETLQHWKKYAKRPVFDFKLYQSIDSATYWNLYNLFDGPNASKNDDGDIFYYKKGSTFFRKFKQERFLTAYSSDLCYSRVWRGQDLGPIGQWAKFLEVSRELDLDNIGLAEIACQTLHPYTCFSDYQKCFNGQQNAALQLDHLTDLQNFWFSRSRRFMTFWESNINHNIHTHHISFLDEYLANYLRTMLKHPDLMIVIFSDHSTRAQKYVTEYAPESLTDRFHPYLFIILPENAASYFSESELRALETNQNRLLTTRDLHFLFSKFWGNQLNASSSNDRGILSEISPLRTCKDLNYMAVSMFKACFCELNLMTLSPGEMSSLTQFVQRRLNYHIDILSNQTDSDRSKCENLVLRPAAKETFQRYQIDDHKSNISGSFVMINYPFEGEPASFSADVSEERGKMKLLSFDRTDTYSRFDHCTPAPFRDRKLCICGNKTNNGW